MVGGGYSSGRPLPPGTGAATLAGTAAPLAIGSELRRGMRVGAPPRMGGWRAITIAPTPLAPSPGLSALAGLSSERSSWREIVDGSVRGERILGDYMVSVELTNTLPVVYTE